MAFILGILGELSQTGLFLFSFHCEGGEVEAGEKGKSLHEIL